VKLEAETLIFISEITPLGDYITFKWRKNLKLESYFQERFWSNIRRYGKHGNAFR
jgi:hypothetical protein